MNMSKWTKKKLITNICILIVAAITAVFLFYFTENPWFFSASIISLQDSEKMKNNNWDIWYKNDSNMLDVFVSDSLTDISSLTLSIIYDPQNASLDPDQIIAQESLNTDILTNTPWLLVIKFSDFTWWFNYQNSLFELPFSADEDMYHALLSEATVLSNNGENKPLSIWLLNETWELYH